jgi:sugar fermentation stimulation protein A
MRYAEPPLEGRFLRRYKRFLADVELDGGEVVTAHCPNTGSLAGCLVAGAPAWLRDSGDPKRKLRYTFQAILAGDAWVNVDTGLPNRLVAEALQAGALRRLAGYRSVRREVRYGENSRIDVLLEDHPRRRGERCYVEVKNATMSAGRVALFPDAVTARGRKHLQELARVAASGDRAVQLFLVSRGDVTTFRPADDVDPAYGAALREAADRGVEVHAYRARVTALELAIDRPLRVDLRAPAAR